MKAITLIIGLFMLPFMGTTSSIYATSSISGVWRSDCGTLTLLIEGDGTGLRVRNHKYGNWAYYDRLRGRRNTYIGNRYKSLQIRNSREILFEDRARRASLILRKTKIGRGYATARSGKYGSTYRNTRDGQYFDVNKGRYTDRYVRDGLDRYDAKKLRKSIDDKWDNREYRVRIRIKDTDSGIKMKRDDRKGYTYYLQDYRNPRVFSDSRGNSIEIISKYEIVWYDANTRRSLYFARD